MGALRLLFTITTMFSLTHCYELSFVLDIPQVVDGITNMASNAITTLRAQKDSEMEGATLSEKLTKISWDIFGYMSTLLSSMSRRMNYEDMKPKVEVGPGVVKSEIVEYPPNYFLKRLKYLLKIKQREEEVNKPLIE